MKHKEISVKITNDITECRVEIHKNKTCVFDEETDVLKDDESLCLQVTAPIYEKFETKLLETLKMIQDIKEDTLQQVKGWFYGLF